MASPPNKEPPAPPRAATIDHTRSKNRNTGDKKPRKLDPQAQEQIRLRREAPEHFHGPIRPKLLVAALPRRGPHRSWGDAVTVFVLEEIMDAYNVPKDSDPWWSGSLYAVNRKTLAARFDTTPDTISASLSWLAELDLIGRSHTTIMDGEGVTVTRRTMAWPKLNNIAALLESAAKGKQPDPPAKTRRKKDVKKRIPSAIPSRAEKLEPVTSGHALKPTSDRLKVGQMTGSSSPKRQVEGRPSDGLFGTPGGTPKENTTTTTAGSGGCVRPSACGGLRPPAPPASCKPQEVNSPVAQQANNAKNNGQEQSSRQSSGSLQSQERSRTKGCGEEAQKFIRFIQVAYPLQFRNPFRITATEEQAAGAYFRASDRSVLEVASIWTYGSLLVGESCTNANGEVYHYGACRSTRNLAKFFEKIHMVESDVVAVWGKDHLREPADVLLQELCTRLPLTSEEVSELFADELAEIRLEKKRTQDAERRAQQEAQEAGRKSEEEKERRHAERLANPSAQDVAKAHEVLELRVRELRGERICPSILPRRLSDAITVLKSVGEDPTGILARAEKESKSPGQATHNGISASALK